MVKFEGLSILGTKRASIQDDFLRKCSSNPRTASYGAISIVVVANVDIGTGTKIKT